jgi:hypothetical protein
MKTPRTTTRLEYVSVALSLTMCATAATGDFYPRHEARVVPHLTFFANTGTANVSTTSSLDAIVIATVTSVSSRREEREIWSRERFNG